MPRPVTLPSTCRDHSFSTKTLLHHHPPGRPDTITPEGVNCLYSVQRMLFSMTAWNIFWGRTNALDPWILSHCFFLPGCILHSSELCLHISFATAQQARVAQRLLGQKNPNNPKLTLVPLSAKTCVTQANPYRFSESGQKLICYYFPSVLFSRALQALLFWRKNTD